MEIPTQIAKKAQYRHAVEVQRWSHFTMEFCLRLATSKLRRLQIFYTQTPLHTAAFTHRHFYTQRLLHADPLCTQTLLHTDAFTHIHFYAQTVSHTHAFTHRRQVHRTAQYYDASNNMLYLILQ